MLGSTQIRCARKELGITQTDLAAASGISRKRISAIELGAAISDTEHKSLADGFAAIRLEQARKLIAPVITTRRNVFMDGNEIENLQAKQKHCEERIASLQGTLVLIAAREAKARDGISLLADTVGAKAAFARRTFSAVLSECAENRAEAQRQLDANSRLLEQTKNFLRQKEAQVDAGERERKIDKLLNEVGPIAVIV